MALTWSTGQSNRETVGLRAAAVLGCALLSTGAAVIHFAVLGEHWKEWWGYGLFFVAAAWLQLSWAAAVAWRPSRPLLLAGAVGSLAIAALWLLTRTHGIPLGPEAGEREEATLSDVVASTFELAVAVGATAIALARVERWTLRPAAASVLLLVVAVAVLGPTTASLVDAAGGEGDEHHAAGGDEDHESAASEETAHEGEAHEGEAHVADSAPSTSPSTPGDGYYP